METFYEQLNERIQASPEVLSVYFRQFVGTTFIYIKLKQPEFYSKNQVARIIEHIANQVILDTCLSYEAFFLRYEDNMYVFRFRFFVPNRKNFCCGNLCEDCILKQKH